MTAPERIFFDARVLHNVATSPEDIYVQRGLALDDGEIQIVSYVLEEKHEHALAEIRAQFAETEIPIQLVVHEGRLLALSNRGRILEFANRDGNPTWEPIA